ncbi:MULTISPECIES: Uma2 family endonuclease [unclassified Streptomyces]|uniref:Uma2 family endonuclease n=1 Tax=unclassified Streptomyces TaxID=2593676 RepID=UPI003246EF4C|nr:Uma2 family endonuclease [Streptomyces sp. NBC_00998]
MTVVETDRIEMADISSEQALDEMFEALEPVPEGLKVEIVEGTVYMSPQRDTHWEIIRRIVRALEDEFGMGVKALSDVRIDFPGRLNGFAPDVALLSADATKDDAAHWRHQDVEFVAEVISKGTAANDYGPKKAAYAAAEVPAYLIVDPYTRRCLLHTGPKDGDYATETKIAFGDEIDLTDTVVGLTLDTSEFPRD